MTSKKHSKLEKLVSGHHSNSIPEHHDPAHLIHNHVVTIVFISLMFLASIFVFLTAVPSDSHATAYAIVEFKMPEFTFLDSFTQALDGIRSSNDQPYFLLTMFVAWIMVFGLINLALHEKEYKNRKL